MARFWVLYGLLSLHLGYALAQEANVLHYIDPLIGTGFGGLKQEKKGGTRSYVDNRAGHVFAGATLPFGMAKAVADVNGENQGGYASDYSNITGFSHMHDSGTGG
ncbi:hypothetical protein KCU64_g11011, partial [Aureobasidium melanogenum]